MSIVLDLEDEDNKIEDSIPSPAKDDLDPPSTADSAATPTTAANPTTVSDTAANAGDTAASDATATTTTNTSSSGSSTTVENQPQDSHDTSSKSKPKDGDDVTNEKVAAEPKETTEEGEHEEKKKKVVALIEVVFLSDQVLEVKRPPLIKTARNKDKKSHIARSLLLTKWFVKGYISDGNKLEWKIIDVSFYPDHLGAPLEWGTAK
jgi:hypothetical protein